MPPKRKAAAKKNQKPVAKKAKTEIDEVKTALTKGPSFRKKIHKIDKEAESRFTGGKVVDDYDCMLNQTDISNNNNKYYIIQLINHLNKFYVWTRWGRVGESGQNLTLGPFNMKEEGVKTFESKFTSKTKNKWDDRKNFSASKGKYTLLEMADEDEGKAEMVLTQSDSSKNVKYAPSTLDKSTQFLMDLIFQTDMFKHAMVELKLDPKKLPLGNLSKPQIMKGFEVLEELQDVITKKKPGNMTELSSKFYTIIPHSFGRMVPPAIKTEAEVREKLDMLIILSDIESTQSLLKTQETQKPKNAKKEELAPNPLDGKYKMLDVDLELLSPKSEEYKIIQDYVSTTKGRQITVKDIWKVDRKDEGTRYRKHKDLANRKLLWHGTNIAVVAAILKSGLRIMPHSGGRVGRGIYFASENGKSAAYVSCSPNRLGIMFLNEVALGKSDIIHTNACSLTKAPNGYDSVLAEGQTEPDSKTYKELKLEGQKVVVPVGKPVKRSNNSGFYQSEYLIYQESQTRIRYMLLCQF